MHARTRTDNTTNNNDNNSIDNNNNNIEEERDAVGQRKTHKEKFGLQPDLNLRRYRLAARSSQMVTAKPLGQLKKRASWQVL